MKYLNFKTKAVPALQIHWDFQFVLAQSTMLVFIVKVNIYKKIIIKIV